MIQEEHLILNEMFEFNGKIYDCTHAIRRDIKMIIQEAETSHKDSFDKTYDRQSLTPNKVRIFLDGKGKPAFGIILYLIEFKDGIDFGFSKAINGKWYSAHYIKINDNGLASFNKAVTGDTAIDAGFGIVCWLLENKKI